MKQTHSPQLREAMDKIKAVMVEYDIGGIVTLHDGLGMSEYAMFIDLPSWSTLEVGEKQVRVKISAKSDPEKANRVVNMIWSAADVVSNISDAMVQVKYLVNKHLAVESEESGKFYPRGKSEDLKK